jgi:hypothetical protein
VILYEPKRVAVFQDDFPWGYTSINDILMANGFGVDMYNVSDIGKIDLSRYWKVIIASVQTLEFNDAVIGNRSWFENYAAGGGVLELHLADWNAWNGKLPGNFDYIVAGSDNLTILDPLNPMVTLPSLINNTEIDNWSGSTHGYLWNLPIDTHVVIQDDNNDPVLVEIPFGSGSIIATSMTLEHGYGNGYSTILENIILYKPFFPSLPMIPSLEDYPDFSYEYDTPNQFIKWNATDDNPNLYVVLMDDFPILNGPWSSGVDIIVDVSGLLPGDYNYTIVVTDFDGLFATDTVIVEVYEITSSEPTSTIPSSSEPFSSSSPSSSLPTSSNDESSSEPTSSNPFGITTSPGFELIGIFISVIGIVIYRKRKDN